MPEGKIWIDGVEVARPSIEIVLNFTSNAPGMSKMPGGGRIDYTRLSELDRHFETIRNLLELCRRGTLKI